MTASKPNPTAYIAARDGRIQDARRVATILSNHNITITASWLNKDESEDQDHSAYPRIAAEDLHDIARADLFIFLSEEPTNPFGRGSRHVELGYALALGKIRVGIGPKENIFHHLPQLRFA